MERGGLPPNFTHERPCKLIPIAPGACAMLSLWRGWWLADPWGVILPGNLSPGRLSGYGTSSTRYRYGYSTSWTRYRHAAGGNKTVIKPISASRAPTGTICWSNVDMSLGHSRTRWPNIKTALGERVVFNPLTAGPEYIRFFLFISTT